MKIRGTLIYWDTARSVLYFSKARQDIAYDEADGIFKDLQGNEVAHDEIEVGTILNQDLIETMSSNEAIRGRQGVFLPFKGFNEEVEFELIDVDW